jgi:hypothetical protein
MWQDYGLEKIFAEENLDYDTQAVLRREIAPNRKESGIYKRYARYT